MTEMEWMRQQIAWMMGVRVMTCPEQHRYATYLARCPWCVQVLLPSTQGDGWMELDGA